MNKEIQFIKQIEDALLKDDVTALQSYIVDFGIYLRDHYEKFPEEVFTQMIYLFKSDSFNRNQYGFTILDIFLREPEYGDPEYIGKNIKRQLVELMELIYPDILVPVTGLRATEGIIDLADNEQALGIFIRLEKKCDGSSRTLLPTALSCVYEHCEIPKSREKVILLLKKLASDQNEDVRRDANHFLKDLT